MSRTRAIQIGVVANFPKPSSRPRVTMRSMRTTLNVILLATLLGGSAAARASGQDAPAKTRQMKSKEESDAFQALQSEKDPHQKLTRGQAFWQQYPES